MAPLCFTNSKSIGLNPTAPARSIRSPPAASTTSLPFHLKLRAISETSDKIAPSSKSTSKATIASNASIPTLASNKAKPHFRVPRYEQERAKSKEKSGRLVLKFKTPPACTKGARVTPRSELESKLEPEEKTRAQGCKSGKATERWVVDAVVIPIHR
ncbi:hypothetical protein BGZ96_010512 [Linnemannia gamsii]|uniref:Uncharacterized protein n=1 Tax=Linnemannia gamsii TaxID=64522 RepID=A0ABQ7JU17_9FUNG|nr:hypothetical protein BGZ96_010512 [Linnemannia gamsii]